MNEQARTNELVLAEQSPNRGVRDNFENADLVIPVALETVAATNAHQKIDDAKLLALQSQLARADFGQPFQRRSSDRNSMARRGGAESFARIFPELAMSILSGGTAVLRYYDDTYRRVNNRLKSNGEGKLNRIIASPFIATYALARTILKLPRHVIGTIPFNATAQAYYSSRGSHVGNFEERTRQFRDRMDSKSFPGFM
jgi:hypothetical protein